jgi:hypothetical protein
MEIDPLSPGRLIGAFNAQIADGVPMALRVAAEGRACRRLQAVPGRGVPPGGPKLYSW